MKQPTPENSQFPPAPRAYVELNQLLVNPRASARDVAALVEADGPLAARVHGIATAVGNASQISIPDAIAILGLEITRAAVLAAEVARVFPIPNALPDFALEALEQHSILVAQLAKRILHSDPAGDLAFVASLLQDSGQIILASRAPKRFSTVLANSRAKQLPLHVEEAELFGVNHAELGAYVLGLWGVPPRIVQTIRDHLRPQRAAARMLNPSAALYIANQLIENPQMPASVDLPERAIGLDLAYLRDIGAAHQLPEWRHLARQLTGPTRSGIRLAIPDSARPQRMPSRG